MSNHWYEWLPPGPRTEVGRTYVRAHWMGKSQHVIHQMAGALNLPVSLLLAVPPVPAKAAHKRRFGR